MNRPELKASGRFFVHATNIRAIRAVYRSVIHVDITTNTFIMDKYICTVCQWVYDPEVGDPDGGIAPGTAFEDIPDDWVCPLCGVGKDMFEVVK